MDRLSSLCAVPTPGLEHRLPLVVAAMQALIDQDVPAAPYRQLSLRLVAGAERQARLLSAGLGWVPYIDLPFDVLEAAGGDANLAPPLAAACAFVFSGLDVIDDIADGDTQPQWAGVPIEQQTLAGLSALVSYPQRLIGRLPLPAERTAAMLALIARRILLACVGQQVDLALAGATAAAPEQVEASVTGKSGEQLALYCEWAALAAGATGDAVEDWGDFGRALGTAGQIRGDLTELCHDDWCRDLASGNRTLPIACHLARLGSANEPFLALLERARTEREAQREVRQALLDSGAIRAAALVAQVHSERGRRALQRTQGRHPALDRLQARLDGRPAGARMAASKDDRGE